MQNSYFNRALINFNLIFRQMETIYLKNVSILKLKELSRSYSAKTEQVTAKLATIEDDWLVMYHVVPTGMFTERMNMSAKKFIELEKSTEIKHATFKKWYAKLEIERLEALRLIEANHKKQANDQVERVEAAKVIVLDNKSWLSDYMAERQMNLNDLGRHKIANKIAFRLAHRFDVKQSDLRNAFKELFRSKLNEAKLLWSALGDVLTNDDEELDADFMNGDEILFHKGSCVYEVWHWFEEKFDVSVAKDLMNLE